MSGRHRHGGPVGPHPDGRPTAVSLEDPAAVVGTLEGVEGAAEVRAGRTAGFVPQHAGEAFGTAGALGLGISLRTARWWPQGAGAPAPFNRRPRPSTARNSYPGHPLIARRGERECDGLEAWDTPGWPTPAPPTVASASSHAAAVAARPGSTGRVVRVLEPFDDQRYDDGPDAKISVPRPVPA
jgi:hypothetical protein